MTVIKQLHKAAALGVLAMTQTVSMAQSVTITYGPDVASVPTLSEWGMIIMAVVLAGFAAYAMRKNANSKTIVSLMLGAIGLLGAGLGHQVIHSTWALPAPQMTNPAGGVTTAIPLGIGNVSVQNTTNVPLRVITVSDPSVENAVGTTCKSGVVVPPSASCILNTGVT